MREPLTLLSFIILCLLTTAQVESTSSEEENTTVIDVDMSVEQVTTSIPPGVFITMRTMVESISKVCLEVSPKMPSPDTAEMAKELTVNYYIRKTGNTIELINKIIPILINLRDNMTDLVQETFRESKTKSVEEYKNWDTILERGMSIVEEHIKGEYIQRQTIAKTIESLTRYFQNFEELLSQKDMKEREELGIQEGGSDWPSRMMRPHTQTPQLIWQKGSRGSFPSNAIEASSVSSARLFICRVSVGNQLSIGKFDVAKRTCSVPYGGVEIFYPDYEILTGPQDAYRWVSTSLGVSVENAFPSGIINDGTLMYVGRREHGGSLIPGKVVLVGGWVGMYLPSDGKENYYTTYEILVATNSEEVEMAANELRTTKPYPHQK